MNLVETVPTSAEVSASWSRLAYRLEGALMRHEELVLYAEGWTTETWVMWGKRWARLRRLQYRSQDLAGYWYATILTGGT